MEMERCKGAVTQYHIPINLPISFGSLGISVMVSLSHSE